MGHVLLQSCGWKPVGRAEAIGQDSARNHMLGEIFSPASCCLCDKSYTFPTAQRIGKKKPILFPAIFRLHLCQQKDITKAAKALSSKPLLPAFPHHLNCGHFSSAHFQATITSRALILPPTPGRVQGRRTALRFGGPHAAEQTALWWQLASKCGHRGTSQMWRGCSGSYLRDADAVGLIVELWGVVVHVSHLDVDRPFDHLPPQG